RPQLLGLLVRAVRRGGRCPGRRGLLTSRRGVRRRRQPGHPGRLRFVRAAPSAHVSGRPDRRRLVSVLWGRRVAGDVFHRRAGGRARLLHRPPRPEDPRALPGTGRPVTLAVRWGIPVAVIAACVGYLIYSASGG